MSTNYSIIKRKLSVILFVIITKYCENLEHFKHVYLQISKKAKSNNLKLARNAVCGEGLPQGVLCCNFETTSFPKKIQIAFE